MSTDKTTSQYRQELNEKFQLDVQAMAIHYGKTIEEMRALIFGETLKTV